MYQNFWIFPYEGFSIQMKTIISVMSSSRIWERKLWNSYTADSLVFRTSWYVISFTSSVGSTCYSWVSRNLITSLGSEGFYAMISAASLQKPVPSWRSGNLNENMFSMGNQRFLGPARADPAALSPRSPQSGHQGHRWVREVWTSLWSIERYRQLRLSIPIAEKLSSKTIWLRLL